MMAIISVGMAAQRIVRLRLTGHALEPISPALLYVVIPSEPAVNNVMMATLIIMMVVLPHAQLNPVTVA